MPLQQSSKLWYVTDHTGAQLTEAMTKRDAMYYAKRVSLMKNQPGVLHVVTFLGTHPGDPGYVANPPAVSTGTPYVLSGYVSSGYFADEVTGTPYVLSGYVSSGYYVDEAPPSPPPTSPFSAGDYVTTGYVLDGYFQSNYTGQSITCTYIRGRRVLGGSIANRVKEWV